MYWALKAQTPPCTLLRSVAFIGCSNLYVQCYIQGVNGLLSKVPLSLKLSSSKSKRWRCFDGVMLFSVSLAKRSEVGRCSTAPLMTRSLPCLKYQLTNPSTASACERERAQLGGRLMEASRLTVKQGRASSSYDGQRWVTISDG